MKDVILIVDDKVDIVFTLKNYFLYNNYTVLTAANGIDISIVLRVFENLLANAVHFAKEKIIISAEVQDILFGCF